MGRAAYGVKGITLDEGDEVVGADVVEPGTTILTVTENGYGKRTVESEYRVQGRGGKGIIDIKTTERNGKVVGLTQVKDDDEVMLVTNGGMLIRMTVKEISVIGRNTQGVRLITLESEAEKVTGISKLPEAKVEDGGEGSTAEGLPLSAEAEGEAPVSEEGAAPRRRRASRAPSRAPRSRASRRPDRAPLFARRAPAEPVDLERFLRARGSALSLRALCGGGWGASRSYGLVERRRAASSGVERRRAASSGVERCVERLVERRRAVVERSRPVSSGVERPRGRRGGHLAHQRRAQSRRRPLELPARGMLNPTPPSSADPAALAEMLRTLPPSSRTHTHVSSFAA